MSGMPMTGSEDTADLQQADGGVSHLRRIERLLYFDATDRCRPIAEVRVEPAVGRSRLGATVRIRRVSVGGCRYRSLRVHGRDRPLYLGSCQSVAAGRIGKSATLLHCPADASSLDPRTGAADLQHALALDG